MCDVMIMIDVIERTYNNNNIMEHHDGALRLLLPSMLPTSLDKQYMMSGELHFYFPLLAAIAGDTICVGATIDPLKSLR